MKHHHWLKFVVLCLAILSVVYLMHKNSQHFGIYKRFQPTINPKHKGTTSKPRTRKEQPRQKKKITGDVRSTHQKRLFMEIDTLMKKPPLQWKEFLNHTIAPLFKSTPCFCSPCGEVSKPVKSCKGAQSQKVNDLSDVTRSAARLNLTRPFQRIPSASRLTGGAWKPSQCRSQQKMAIIIPFRDRWKQVNTLLEVLHPFLQRQNICYRVFVIEQCGNAPFNKGRLNNAGFLEVAKRFRFDCVIYHDTDFIPFSDLNRYHCSNKPIHMVSGMNTTQFRIPYHSFLGGVLAFSVEQYVRLNGFSNLYWGWGLEDDDIEIRMKSGAMFGYTRPQAKEGYYRVQDHPRQKLHSIQQSRRHPLLATCVKRRLYDGLNSVKYEVIRERTESAYTHIMVCIGKEPKDFDKMGN